MSGFTKSFTFTIPFESDEVTFVMERMKRKDALKIIPFMGEPNTDGTLTISFKDQIAVMDVAADLLPKYIKTMKGLKDEDGNGIAVDDMLDEAYFLKLVGEVLNKLMTKSFIGKDDVKKLNAQQEKSTEDSEVTNITT